jgi:hypothetical protein
VVRQSTAAAAAAATANIKTSKENTQTLLASALSTAFGNKISLLERQFAARLFVRIADRTSQPLQVGVAPTFYRQKYNFRGGIGVICRDQRR